MDTGKSIFKSPLLLFEFVLHKSYTFFSTKSGKTKSSNTNKFCINRLLIKVNILTIFTETILNLFYTWTFFLILPKHIYLAVGHILLLLLATLFRDSIERPSHLNLGPYLFLRALCSGHSLLMNLIIRS